jgi:hypothetical protein
MSPEDLRGRVDAVVVRREWSASPEAVASMQAEPGLVLGGAAACRFRGVAAGGRGPEVWLPEARAAGVVERHGLSPGTGLVLVGVKGMWPFTSSDRYVPRCLLPAARPDD